jgi:hypothetical protein
VIDARFTTFVSGSGVGLQLNSANVNAMKERVVEIQAFISL